MEYIAIIISIISIAIQYFGKIKSENLKQNHELDLQRYNDLKNFHKEAIRIEKEILEIRKNLPTRPTMKELQKLIPPLRKLCKIAF